MDTKIDDKIFYELISLLPPVLIKTKFWFVAIIWYYPSFLMEMLFYFLCVVSKYLYVATI